MDVNARNRLFSTAEIDRIDLWPKIAEYEDQPRTFRFTFGLGQLPEQPGILLIRGPRQYGKSTWLELALRDTLRQNGPGSAYFLNGDDIADEDDLEGQITTLLPSFQPDARVKRLFVDEISAVPRWERGLKRLADRGELRQVLVVTTGSKRDHDDGGQQCSSHEPSRKAAEERRDTGSQPARGTAASHNSPRTGLLVLDGTCFGPVHRVHPVLPATLRKPWCRRGKRRQ
jgi:hypothetical protein